jgi:hypothetical protein
MHNLKFFLMFNLPHSKSGVGLLKVDILDCLTLLGWLDQDSLEHANLRFRLEGLMGVLC